MAKDKLYADLRVACGGRIAEEMIFGKDKVTTGASSDIKMVSDIARRMVTEWGLSDKLGFLAYEANEQEVFLGRSVSQQKNLSDNTASIVDEEIRRIADSVYLDAQKMLKKYSKQLKKVAEMAHDGMARAIRPIHTQFDGDTVFAVSMPWSEVETTPDAQLNSIGIAGAKALEFAIVDAVRSAKSVGDVVACCDWHID